MNTFIQFADDRMGEMLIAAGTTLLIAAFSITYLF